MKKNIKNEFFIISQELEEKWKNQSICDNKQ